MTASLVPAMIQKVSAQFSYFLGTGAFADHFISHNSPLARTKGFESVEIAGLYIT